MTFPLSLSTGGVTTATSGPVIQALEDSMRFLTAALVAALTLALAPIAAGSSLSAGEKKQQLRRYYKANGVVRWIGSHARVTEYHPDPRVKRRWKNAARFWVQVREDAWRQLHPAPAPVLGHLQGWLCIHTREGAWNAQTGNGFYGGLQMTFGWAGRVGNAALLSPGQQIAAAEAEAASHGWSYSWMHVQWPMTFPPCAGYFG